MSGDTTEAINDERARIVGRLRVWSELIARRAATYPEPDRSKFEWASQGLAGAATAIESNVIACPDIGHPEQYAAPVSPKDARLHIGDVVVFKATGMVTKVQRFAHDGTTDFWADNGTGPYKQGDVRRQVDE